MMRGNLLLVACFFAGCHPAGSQIPRVADPAFDRVIKNHLTLDVPPIGCKDLETMLQHDQVLLLDAREPSEYEVSHIAGARHAGYTQFDIGILEGVRHDEHIVVYCSIGYRSEKIARQLIKQGYSNVYNLYGSIFEWANDGKPLVDQQGEITQRIHTYNRKWSQWVTNESLKKVW